MKLKFLLLFSLISSSLSVQTSLTKINPSKYLIFEENFDNNDRGWLDAEDLDTQKIKAYTSEIKDGLLRYSVTEGKIPLANAPKGKIDFSKDFEIEYSCKILSAQKKNRYAATLFWGRDTLNSSCYLYASQSGKMTFVTCTTYDFTECAEYREAKANWRKEDFNKIVLRKAKGTYSLYVNDKFVKDYPYKDLRGSMIGLGAGPDTEVVYDYIRVYHLE